MNSSNPINFLTVDLEDYYQVSAFETVVKRDDWMKYESRLEYNTHRILQIINESTSNPISATFFVLAWNAEKHPKLIREIQQNKYEIASHGYDHRLIYNMNPKEFREDVRKSKKILEDLTGGEILGYRAPSYSITNKSQWAFEVLMEEGFRYDSSIFPIHHDFYGFPNAPRFPFMISLDGNGDLEFSKVLDFKQKQQHSDRAALTDSSTHSLRNNSSKNSELNVPIPQSAIRNPNSIVEFPLSTIRFAGQNFPISGGGYFRLFPYPLIKRGLRRINEEEEHPFIFYIHPWELDPDQPRINSISRKSRFRHYVNLHKTESKFKKLLTDFRFSAISDLLNGNTAEPQHGNT